MPSAGHSLATALQPCVTEGAVRDRTVGTAPDHALTRSRHDPMVLLIPLAVIAIVVSTYLLIGALQN